MVEMEIYSVSYGRYIHEGKSYFSVVYRIDEPYNVGTDQAVLLEIDALKGKNFKATFDNGYELHFPLMSDTEIIYRPKEEKNESGTDKNK